MKELTHRNEYNINDSQSDIVEELIHVEIDAIMLNEDAVNQDQTKYLIIAKTKMKIWPKQRSDWTWSS